ncbi:2-Hydroxyacid oxidase 1-like isoform X3 [Convolutriloba macropyga]|uniref:2-Hydroxyacid oxidase 1-like isoform X3 n=1 Tax=Convolutriloba macropyga TaxID=536237 RepID=UPI003F528869
MAQSLSHLVCLADFEREARHILPRNALNYYRSGADDEITLGENEAAYRRLRLIPRVLRDVEGVSVGGLSILGEEVSSPVCVAPTAMQKMAHSDGELATARACAKHGTLMSLSTLTTTGLETIAEQVPNLKRWLQLYIYKLANFDANVKVDSANKSKKVEDSGGSGLSGYVDVIQNHSLTWNYISWLRSHTKMKIVLKGIHSPEDAKLAVQAGVDGIWVSNHGGRQLDSVPATIEMLPDIVRAVKGSNVEVFVDGGIRTGTDVLKALALGANAVFIGRPVLWGLACGGEEGVSKTLQTLNNELKLAMALSGCRTLKDISPHLVRHQSSFSSL